MQLNEHDYNRLHAFYQEALEYYGPQSASAVHWTDRHNQELRFSIIEPLIENNSSVLDVGCGLGDLYAFLARHGKSVQYVGIDIVPEFIELATQHFPDLTFKQTTVFDINQHFDYVVASGALSFKIENYQHFYFDMIRRMFELCTKGIAFNMLRRGNHIDDSEFATYAPEEVLAFGQTLTPHATLRTDYLQHDFTIILRK